MKENLDHNAPVSALRGAGVWQPPTVPDHCLPRPAFTARALRGASIILLFAGKLMAADPFEDEIASFEARDRTNPPPAGAILFLGSSSIRFWSTLDTDFSQFTVINRGFGGSHLADSVHYFDRIVLPYHPRQILLYAGDNDLAADETPERILEDFRELTRLTHRGLPMTRISYLAIKPSPVRWHLAAKILATNRLIAEEARHDLFLDYIDSFTPLLGPGGEPRPELFRDDRLHLNGEGYALWAGVVRPWLK